MDCWRSAIDYRILRMGGLRAKRLLKSVGMRGADCDSTEALIHKVKYSRRACRLKRSGKRFEFDRLP